MSGGVLSIVLDIVVLIGLGFTIHYALRLSKSLNNFRKYRSEFKKSIEELSGHIERAEKAIHSLKSESTKASRDLQSVVHDARLLADELQLMNQSGDGLARRLEDLAGKSGRIIQGGAKPETEDYSEIFEEDSLVASDGGDTFFIQDRDFEDQDNGGPESEAERDLYEALKKKKKASGGGLF